MKQITQLDLAVHLFDTINRVHISNIRGIDITTEYQRGYGHLEEKLLINAYRKRIERLSCDENAHILFITHSYAEKGIIHNNTKKILHLIYEYMPNRCTIVDGSIKKNERAKNLLKYINVSSPDLG